jgi:glycosyltransferase involved in cell wall biosynthesis
MARYVGLVQEAILECSGVEANLAQLDVAAGKSRLPLSAWFKHLAVWRAVSTMRADAADICHVLDGSYAYIVPVIRKRWPQSRVLVTVHDLIPMLQAVGDLGPPPSWPARMVLRRVRSGLGQTDRILAVSDCTAKDVRARLDRHKNINVVPSALSSAFSAARRESVSNLTRSQVMGRYILHIGNSAFYKNRSMVLRVFAAVHAAYPEVTLRIIGEPLTASERRLGSALNLTGVTDVAGGLADSDVADVCRRAEVMLFPSLYEGFGWPPLEAMACGCPVVCSNAASLPEVVGDAALTAAPDDEAMLTRHCLDVLGKPTIRADLVNRGLQRAELFTVKRMAEGLIHFYRQALETPRNMSGVP